MSGKPIAQEPGHGVQHASPIRQWLSQSIIDEPFTMPQTPEMQQKMAAQRDGLNTRLERLRDEVCVINTKCATSHKPEPLISDTSSLQHSLDSSWADLFAVGSQFHHQSDISSRNLSPLDLTSTDNPPCSK